LGRGEEGSEGQRRREGKLVLFSWDAEAACARPPGLDTVKERSGFV